MNKTGVTYENKHDYEAEDYSIALQKAIEHHCRGREIPRDIENQCPHHTNLLNDFSNKNKKEDFMKDRICIINKYKLS